MRETNLNDKRFRFCCVKNETGFGSIPTWLLLLPASSSLQTSVRISIRTPRKSTCDFLLIFFFWWNFPTWKFNKTKKRIFNQKFKSGNVEITISDNLLDSLQLRISVESINYAAENVVNSWRMSSKPRSSLLDTIELSFIVIETNWNSLLDQRVERLWRPRISAGFRGIARGKCRK